MKLFIAIIVVALLVIVAKVFGAGILSNNVKVLIISPLPVESANPAPTPVNDLVNQLMYAGESYLDSENRFNFLYFSDYSISQEGETRTRIYKRGATQKGQTEIYDGVLMVLEPVNLGTQTLSEYVDRKISSSTEDGTSQIIQAKSPYTINGYTGYIYVVRGLGESTIYIFQKDTASKTALEISTLVSDPQNVGYQKEVDAILQTVKLFK